MRYKKIFMLIIILTFLIAVTAVSAADNATDEVAGVEITTDDSVGVEN
jgi:hypothetical protein